MKYFIPLIMLLNTYSNAKIYQVEEFTKYVIRKENVHSVSLVLSTSFETADTCNHFSLHGELRKVEVSRGTKTIVQDYVADMRVTQTEMGCPAGKKRRIVLTSKKLVLFPKGNDNYIYVTIIAPSSFKLSIGE